MKVKNSIIVGIAIGLIFYVIFTNPLNEHTSAIFAQKQGTMTKTPSASTNTTSTTGSSKTQTLNITNANGNFGSLQNDQTGKPAWIVVGPWKMHVSQGATMNVKTPTPNLAVLNGTLWMVKLDGTSKHSHKISDFKLTSSTVNKNVSATFNGTATITMNQGSTKNVPVKDVPISIKFLGKNALSLWIDPAKTQNHFGNTPVYSFVWKTH